MLTIREINKHTVIEVEERQVFDLILVSILKKQLYELFHSGCFNIVLDLSSCRQISKEAYEKLLNISQQLKNYRTGFFILDKRKLSTDMISRNLSSGIPRITMEQIHYSYLSNLVTN